MGKFTMGNKIQPKTNKSANGKSVKRNVKKNLLSMKPSTLNKKRSQKSPYFADPMIVPRVKTYLEENRTKCYIDMDIMVDDLQKRYRDYAKKKRSAFTAVVRKAFNVVLQSYGDGHDQHGSDLSDEEENEDEEDFSERDDEDLDDEDEEEENLSDSHLMNDEHHLGSMVHRGNISKSSFNNAHNPMSCSAGDQKELINISSDEEGSCKKVTEQPLQKHVSCPMPSLYPTSKLFGKVNRVMLVPTPGKQQASAPPYSVQPPNLGLSLSPHTLSLRPQVATKTSAGRPSVEPTAAGPNKTDTAVTYPTTKFKDIAMSNKVKKDVLQLVLHMHHPEVYSTIGISPPRGFLLHGPPGCGKTLLAHAIAGELGLAMLKVAGPQLVGGVSGESEERIRELFVRAADLAPCVLFLDEVDSICPRRDTAQREMERRIVAQLLCSLDGLSSSLGGDRVLVVGATNRPDSIDPALRRAGRFDREVSLGIPDTAARTAILRTLCAPLRLTPSVALDVVARNTPGYVGADLEALTTEAAMAAIARILADFEAKSMSRRKRKIGMMEDLSRKKKRHVISVPEIVLASSDDVTVLQYQGDKKDKVLEENAPIEVNVEEEDKDKTDHEASSRLEVNTEVSKVEEEKNDTVSGNKEEKLVELNSGDTKNDDEKKDEEDKKEGSKVEGKVEENASIKDSSTAEIEVMDISVVTVSSDVKQAESSNDIDIIEDIEIIPKTPDSNCDAESGFGLWLHSVPPLTPAQLQDLHIEMIDFQEALKAVQPSAKREGFATVPDVTWDDIGSLKDIRHELEMAIMAPIKYPIAYASLGGTLPMGVLLCGPPGCGKTLLAKAVANEAGVNFISVKGPELLNMYVGESERAVRQCFQRARNSQPCVIFFDEIDALCPKRSDGEGGRGHSMRVVNQLLTEMDGVEGRAGVFLMAATNRPDIVDPAVMRPGRLDKVLYVGLPAPSDRVDILRALTKNGTRPRLEVNVEEVGISESCAGYTGADLAALIREAGVEALQEVISSGLAGAGDVSLSLHARHFESAFAKIRPSVSDKDQLRYEALRLQYAAVPEKRLADG